MYKVIGADGREYGPVAADVLREWIAQGRANGQTRVLQEGSTGWKTLGELSEFVAMNRMYRRRDVEHVLQIKKLLYEDGFTIAGARTQLRDEAKSDKSQVTLPFPGRGGMDVAHIRQGLQEILTILAARR